MIAAKYIVCRSGYSTIMDLAAIGQHAAFIPTPGQPEQEYLAQKFEEQNIAPYATQSEVNLEKLIENYANYKGFAQFKTDDTLLNLAIDDFLTLVDSNN